MNGSSQTPVTAPDSTLEHQDNGPVRHARYPHEPGRLYDCPGCEAECHCTPGYAECIYDGKHNGTAEI